MMGVDRTKLPRPGPVPSFDLPEVRRQRLDNGLGLWTVEHRGVSLVAALLLFPVGSASDPAVSPGLAAATADLLDEGSGDLSAAELHEALARVGGYLSIGVTSDATVIDLLMLSRFTERGLALLADIAGRPRMQAEDVERVLALRLNRFMQLREVPSAVADRAFARLAYGDHPYGHVPLGTEESLRGLGREELLAFSRLACRPDGATLILVGDRSHDELTRAAHASFAAWEVERPAGEQASRADPASVAVGAPSSDRLVLANRPAAAQSELRIGLPAAARRDPDYHTLLVLNTVLGGQFASRINLNLREDKGYTYGARSFFDFRRGAGPFVVQASVQTDKTAASIQEIFGEIEGIRRERPVTQEELALARAALTRGYPRGFETVEQVARALGQLALHGLPESELTQFTERIERVDAPMVTEAAHRHLDPDALSTVVVGDRDSVEPSLESLGRGRPREITP